MSSSDVYQSFLHVDRPLIKCLLHSGKKSEISGYVDLFQTSAPAGSCGSWWFRGRLLLFVVMGEGVPALCLCHSDVRVRKKQGRILKWMHSSHRGLALCLVKEASGSAVCACVCVYACVRDTPMWRVGGSAALMALCWDTSSFPPASSLSSVS